MIEAESTGSRKRSRNGCITCKIRKKKCDELKPNCTECKRLGRDCIWRDPNKTEAQNDELRTKVETVHNSFKMKKKLESKHLNKELSGVLNFELVNKSTSTILQQPIINTKGAYTKFKLNTIDKQKPISGIVAKPSSPTSGHYVKSPISNLLNNEERTSSEENSENGGTRRESMTINSLTSPSVSIPSPPMANIWKDITAFEQEHILPIAEEKREITRAKELEFKNNHPSPASSSVTSASVDSPMVDNNPYPIRLDKHELRLLNNYLENLVRLNSAFVYSPETLPEDNFFIKTFVTLARRDPGVLWGLLAWSGIHLGGDYETKALKYIDQSLNHIVKALDYYKPKDYQVIPNSKEEQEKIIIKLSIILILCDAEIHRGDTRNWSFYLSWGSKLINFVGGPLKFATTEDNHWLVSNFAYHDLMSSSTAERNTYFPIDDYDKVFMKFRKLNPLLGLNKKLYGLLGEVNSLSVEVRKLLEMLEDVEGETPNFRSLFQSISARAESLSNRVEQVRPDPNDIQMLKNEDLETQLMIFETLQIAIKLHLRQSVLLTNPSSVISRLLSDGLAKNLDTLLSSPIVRGLAFPMFIGAINCCSDEDREKMVQRLDVYEKRVGSKGINRTKEIIHKVWLLNNHGNTVVDWYRLLKDLDWDISFA